MGAGPVQLQVLGLKEHDAILELLEVVDAALDVGEQLTFVAPADDQVVLGEVPADDGQPLVALGDDKVGEVGIVQVVGGDFYSLASLLELLDVEPHLVLELRAAREVRGELIVNQVAQDVLGRESEALGVDVSQLQAHHREQGPLLVEGREVVRVVLVPGKCVEAVRVVREVRPEVGARR